MDLRRRHYVIMYNKEGGVLEGWLPNLTQQQMEYAQYIEDNDGTIVKTRHFIVGEKSSKETRARARNTILHHIAEGAYGEEYATTTPS